MTGASYARTGTALEQLSLPLPPGGEKPRISPKRPSTERGGLADLFPYYAGFSFDFAISELSRLRDESSQSLVLDPWNGSGTTTRAAQMLGISAIGVDLNPAANTVARLRCHTMQTVPELDESPAAHPATADVEAEDPLRYWFTTKSIRRIRQWTALAESIAENCQSSASIIYVALFRLVREHSKSFQGSNPTWVRRAKSDDELTSLDDIDTDIRAEISTLKARLRDDMDNRLKEARIVTASSKLLPVPDNSVSAVLTSPPYLTRIDYAIAYARELAVLGVDVWNGTLRHELMGTTLTRAKRASTPNLCTASTQLLEAIYQHESKASRNYYTNQATQYLEDLSGGFDEITRVSKPGAHLTLVVQDSYYKDVHVQLARICAGEAGQRGWEVQTVSPFEVKRSLVDLNRNAQAYIKGAVAESVLRLRLSDSGSCEDRPEAAASQEGAAGALDQVEKV
jgi:hypothetical protein